MTTARAHGANRFGRAGAEPGSRLRGGRRLRAGRWRRTWLLAAIGLMSCWGSPPPIAQAASQAATALDSLLARSRELIKRGDYDSAIDQLKLAVTGPHATTERLRDAYLMLIKCYVFAGNSYRSRLDGRETSSLYYKEARERILECLRIRDLRDTRAEPEGEYPQEMVNEFAEARNEHFGSFRVIGLAPATALVMLDADTVRSRGDGTLGLSDIVVGPHRVRVVHAGHRALEDTITIGPGATLERSYELARGHGPAWRVARAGVFAGALAGLAAALRGNSSGGSGGAPTSGRSLELGPSIRAAGLGGASGALFWGEDTDDWANPAVLGLERGIHYRWGVTQLVPDLADDVWFRTRRVVLGAGGFGIGLPGIPGSHGSGLLEYGNTFGTDPEGNPVAPFRSFEAIRSWGAGVNLPAAFESLARLAGFEPPAQLRRFDAAFGFSRKRLFVNLAPVPKGEARTEATDYGVFGRFTPFDRLESAGSGLPVRLDLGYGFSVSSAGNATVDIFGEPLPITRVYRNSFALRLTSGALSRRGTRRNWIPAESLAPLISAGAVASFDHLGSFYDGENVQHYGLELTLANVLSVRAGNLRDRSGDIHGASYGIGIGYRHRNQMGVQYDWAVVPQASGLADVHRHGLVGFLDPLALLRGRR